ncbi:MAG: NUDIX domain-containing protein [Saezia sp.]
MTCVLKLLESYNDWRNALEESLCSPPVIPREPLLIGSVQIGSVEEERGAVLQKAGLLTRNELGFCIEGEDPHARFAEIACWMHEHGMADQWRNELLSVTDSSGKELAQAERAVARPLGIKTFAVHLVGRTTGGDFWLQRRAAHKSVDAGLLDTLAGGLVSAGESLMIALERETTEEAGLVLQEFPVTGYEGEFKVQQSVNANVGGYMVEHGLWAEREIPDGVVPVNLDGEVSSFVKLSPQEVLEKMRKGEVASVACLIFVRLFAAKNNVMG